MTGKEQLEIEATEWLKSLKPQKGRGSEAESANAFRYIKSQYGIGSREENSKKAVTNREIWGIVYWLILSCVYMFGTIQLCENFYTSYMANVAIILGYLSTYALLLFIGVRLILKVKNK